MVEITRHFTTSTYVVYKNKVLLHEHKKLSLILPPGGHIDRDELPHEAALREVKEETGLDVELLHPQEEISFKDNSIELNRGFHLNQHKINEFHEHLDFTFYAKANSDELKPLPGESKKFIWYTKEELKNSSSLKDAVKYYALEALEKLKE